MGRAGGAVAGLGVGVVALAGLSVLASDPQREPAPIPGALSVIVEPSADAPQLAMEEEPPPVGPAEPGILAQVRPAPERGPAGQRPGVPPLRTLDAPPVPAASAAMASSHSPVAPAAEHVAEAAPVPSSAGPTPVPTEQRARTVADPDATEPSAPTNLAAALPTLPTGPSGRIAGVDPDASIDAPVPGIANPAAPEVPPARLSSTQQPRLPSPDAAPGDGTPAAALPSQDADPAPLVADLAASDPAPLSANPNQPPSVAAMERGKDMPLADPAPVQFALAPAPVPSAPDGITLAQATEPATPTPPEPGRVQLEGGALPGTDAVRVRRPDTEAAPAAPEAASDTLSDSASAANRFAAPFTPPEPARALLSMVLLDDGTLPEASAALAGLSVPVSVALDPSASDAAARMAAYRAAGHEVLALARLPVRAQPQDVEVFLAPALAALPEAVAVLDAGEGGLRNRDDTAEAALSLLARSGLGAVLVEGGFDRGADAAQAAGVPAAEILRDLDGAGQDGTAIRRQLDDALRRAGQDGEAVVLARIRPETLEALTAWVQDRRAEEVALAPVSALLGDTP